MANQQQIIKKTQRAIELFQMGKSNESLSLLNEICKNEIKIPIAWFLIAVIQFQRTDYKNAEINFKRAIELKPDYAEAHNNLAVLYEKVKRLQEAENHYKRAIVLQPNYTNARFHLGNLYQQTGRTDQAIDTFQSVLSLDPKHLKTLNNLALIALNKHAASDALKLLDRAYKLDQNDIEVINNIGYAYRRLGESQKAMDYFNLAITKQSESSTSYSNLALTQQEKGELEQALQSFLKAIEINPTNVVALTNLALLYEQMELVNKAIETFKRAIRADRNYIDAWNGYGVLMKKLERHDEAKQILSEAITEIDPAFMDARYNLAITQLETGDFLNGWKNYTGRPTRVGSTYILSDSVLPIILTGSRILLEQDQGIGDELFFLRFAPELKRRGAFVQYRANPKIGEFVKRLTCIDEYIDENRHSINFDYHISIGDLPLVLESALHDPTPLPIPIYYDDNLRSVALSLLEKSGPPPYIGLTWRAGTNQKRTLFKEAPLDDFAKLFARIPCTLLALQRNPADGEIEQLSRNCGRAIADFTAINNDLPLMAAVLDLIDDYVGVSNTNMHIRAGLNKSAKIVVPHPPDWRWMATGKVSPWFPIFTTYRQTASGSWDLAFSQLAKDLGIDE